MTPIPPVIIDYLVISAVSFTMGNIVGWSWANRYEDLSETQLRRLMAVTLLGVYLVSVLAEIALSEYTTPVLLHGIIGAITGYLFSKEDGFNINLG